MKACERNTLFLASRSSRPVVRWRREGGGGGGEHLNFACYTSSKYVP